MILSFVVLYQIRKRRLRSLGKEAFGEEPTGMRVTPYSLSTSSVPLLRTGVLVEKRRTGDGNSDSTDINNPPPLNPNENDPPISPSNSLPSEVIPALDHLEEQMTRLESRLHDSSARALQGSRPGDIMEQREQIEARWRNIDSGSSVVVSETLPEYVE
jgi:hypothetical protein